jgi:PAS domain S-box-containing protein
MIYTVDDSDIITDINPAGLNMLGGLPYEEVVGRQFEDFVLNPEDRSFFRQRIADEGYVDGYEIILKRGDQSTIFCVETTHSIRDQKGIFLELRGIIKDISERIKNEKELWRSNMELAEANLKLQQTQMLMVQREKLASIGQLAAGIAHEINNPLGFLKSNHIAMERFMGKLRGAWKEVQGSDWPGFRAIAEKWDLDYISNELDKIFEESNEGYARIMQIVSNLKNFSRIEADGDFELYDINAGIESTILVAWNELKYVAEVKKELGLVPQIRARGGEINQVILNILVNAAQAIGSQKRTGKGIITIKTAVKNAMVVCVISDDGPGIPENIRMRIFDPFFTTKEPGKGTGLGLSISYDIIVNKHKGFLHVESEPHRGSSFIIELPLSVSA